MLTANDMVYNGYDVKGLMMKITPIQNKLIAQQAITSFEQETLDLSVTLAAKIQNNSDVYEQKCAAIDNGQTVDIDSDFATS